MRAFTVIDRSNEYLLVGALRRKHNSLRRRVWRLCISTRIGVLRRPYDGQTAWRLLWRQRRPFGLLRRWTTGSLRCGVVGGTVRRWKSSDSIRQGCIANQLDAIDNYWLPWRWPRGWHPYRSDNDYPIRNCWFALFKLTNDNTRMCNG